MKYSCGGLVDATVPESTRPGSVRQVGCEGFAIVSVVGAGVRVGWGAEAGELGVDVSTDGLDGEQAVMSTSSVKRVPIHFAA